MLHLKLNLFYQLLPNRYIFIKKTLRLIHKRRSVSHMEDAASFIGQMQHLFSRHAASCLYDMLHLILQHVASCLYDMLHLILRHVASF